MDPLSNLIAACIAFVGTHFALSHPLRAPLVRMAGDKGFLGIYSLVAFATFGWMIWAFRQLPPSPMGGEIAWAVSSLLTLVALVLFLGSYRGNPALPDPRAAEGLAAKEPAHVFRVTRHPMMWAFALWALAHILIAPAGRTLVISLTIAFLALVGAHLQDRKKQAQLGDGWKAWEAKTSYWPRWGNLLSVGVGLWAVALVIWLAASWAHMALGSAPAGIWLWIA